MKQGVLITNLGTPLSTNLKHIHQYLAEFLTDKRVIDIPALSRYALVYGLILPFRKKKTREAYQAIWTTEGSPLLVNSQALTQGIQEILGPQYQVVLGMRYGKPSLEEALDKLKECDQITMLPLFPQYSSAATGSSIKKVLEILASQENIPSINIISSFFYQQAYISAQAALIKSHLNDSDHLLLSYHGIPERQIHKSGCKRVCTSPCTAQYSNHFCYKAQCHQTSRLLAQELKLASHQYTTSFQSRLGRLPWIKPYTDDMLITLANQGVKNLAIACPSFVIDCLETLEEIGIRAKEQWMRLGGTNFTFIPCLNAQEQWVKKIVDLLNFQDL